MRSPITVLHLIETGGPGGAERMLVHLASRLGPDFRSEAALIRDRWIGKALARNGVRVTMLRNGTEDSGTILRRLVKLIQERHVAILHAHEFFMNTLGLLASLWTRVPLVATIHGRTYYPDRLRRRVAYRLVGRCAGRTVAVSEDISRFLTERIGIPSVRICVVPNGVPVDEEPSCRRVLALRESLGISFHTKVVGTVGSLYRIKGHRYLIDAVAPVITRFPHAVFVVVGHGGLRGELEAQARRLGVAQSVFFLGHREDVPDVLGLCDVFVLPSLSEGMPLALLEAMAAGVPPVATQVGGVSEVLEDGKTGVLVPPADSQAIADGILRLLQDRTLAQQIGKAARTVVGERFSLTKMVEAYQEIYSSLLQRQDGGGQA